MALTAAVQVRSRVTQGCRPSGAVHTVTRADDHVVLELDGRPALPVLLDTLGIEMQGISDALPRLRATLVGLTGVPLTDHPGQLFGGGLHHCGLPWAVGGRRSP